MAQRPRDWWRLPRLRVSQLLGNTLANASKELEYVQTKSLRVFATKVLVKLILVLHTITTTKTQYTKTHCLPY